jgi:hypothetical protein
MYRTKFLVNPRLGYGHHGVVHEVAPGVARPECVSCGWRADHLLAVSCPDCQSTHLACAECAQGFWQADPVGAAA